MWKSYKKFIHKCEQSFIFEMQVPYIFQLRLTSMDMVHDVFTH